MIGAGSEANLPQTVENPIMVRALYAGLDAAQQGGFGDQLTDAEAALATSQGGAWLMEFGFGAMAEFQDREPSRRADVAYMLMQLAIAQPESAVPVECLPYLTAKYKSVVAEIDGEDLGYRRRHALAREFATLRTKPPQLPKNQTYPPKRIQAVTRAINSKTATWRSGLAVHFS